jgi:hypothetical protein
LQRRWLGLFILVVLVAIIAMQISSGSVTLRGGHAIKRTEKPRTFWLSIVFEIVMAAVLLGGLILIPQTAKRSIHSSVCFA